jgi:hypothetical protein
MDGPPDCRAPQIGQGWGTAARHKEAGRVRVPEDRGLDVFIHAGSLCCLCVRRHLRPEEGGPKK